MDTRRATTPLAISVHDTDVLSVPLTHITAARGIFASIVTIGDGRARDRLAPETTKAAAYTCGLFSRPARLPSPRKQAVREIVD